MPANLPPRTDHWPEALKSSALLQGTLTRCGPGYRPVGWPESPAVRCVAIASYLDGRFVAINDTAAWIWGASRRPGSPLEVSTRSGRAPTLSGCAEVQYREFTFRPGEFSFIGDFAVTTPLRTAFDLLRSPRPFTAQRRVACRLLLSSVPTPRESAGRHVSQSNSPDGARVFRRLEECYGSQLVIR